MVRTDHLHFDIADWGLSDDMSTFDDETFLSSSSANHGCLSWSFNLNQYKDDKAVIYPVSKEKKNIDKIAGYGTVLIQSTPCYHHRCRPLDNLSEPAPNRAKYYPPGFLPLFASAWAWLSSALNAAFSILN